MICKKCYVPMVEVMSFSKDRHEKFCKCPLCKRESKHNRVSDKDLQFDDVYRREVEQCNKHI